MKRSLILLAAILCALLCACDAAFVGDAPPGSATMPPISETAPSGAAPSYVSPTPTTLPDPEPIIPIDFTANSQGILTLEDLVIGDFAAYADAEEIIRAFGQPDSDESYEMGATGETIRNLNYSEPLRQFMFTDGALTRALCVDASLAGPRGLKVGSSAQEVIDAFRVDAIAAETAYASPGEVTLYEERAVQTVAEDGSLLWHGSLPPFGEYTARADRVYMIRYMTPRDYREGYYESWPYEVDSDYVYDVQCTLIFSIFDNSVTSWQWHVGALAE